VSTPEFIDADAAAVLAQVVEIGPGNVQEALLGEAVVQHLNERPAVNAAEVDPEMLARLRSFADHPTQAREASICPTCAGTGIIIGGTR
jgi:16S rRNA A1518/A1519 N6-dimethyltransferase RsmA/KsgA/DIM1 with predicted DNA glycosylase/AP lyase activity